MEEKEIIEIIKESYSINSICEKIYGYRNKGTVNKIKKIIDKYEINIEHFCKGINNRKYEIIIKNCPVCKIDFNTKKDHKDEKTTCSYSCSSKYFQHGINNDNFDKNNYELKKEKISCSLTSKSNFKNKFYSFSDEEIEEIIQKYKELKNLRKVSKLLNTSIDCIKKFINYGIENYNEKLSIEERKKIVYDKRIKIKEILVEYKGGKCVNCGYNKCIKALEFHHLDSSKKDFTISSFRYKSLEVQKREVEKCILVCSNCHREIHDKIFKENRLLNNNKSQKREEKIILKKEKIKVNSYCNCGKLKNKIADKCLECFRKEQYEKKPKLEVLLEDIKQLGYRGTGQKYGVSDNCIRKWIKNIIKFEEKYKKLANTYPA